MCVILKCILPQPRIENCRDLQISVGNPDPFLEVPVFFLDLDPTKMKEQINKFNFFLCFNCTNFFGGLSFYKYHQLGDSSF